MMNKNFPAFLTFVLRDLHFPEHTILQYVKRCCCQVKAAEITQCKWDTASATLTTPDDLGKRSTDDFSSASWYKDAFSELGLGPKGEKNGPPPPETYSNWTRSDQSSPSIRGTNKTPTGMNMTPSLLQCKGKAPIWST
jgi:hypothetical protein